LTSNYLGVMIFVIIFLPLPLMLYVPSDATWAIILGGALLILASFWIFEKLVYVRVLHKPDAT